MAWTGKYLLTKCQSLGTEKFNTDFSLSLPSHPPLSQVTNTIGFSPIFWQSASSRPLFLLPNLLFKRKEEKLGDQAKHNPYFSIKKTEKKLKNSGFFIKTKKKTSKDKKNKTTNVPSNVTTAIMIQINYQPENQLLIVNSEHHTSCGDNMAQSLITSRYRITLE